MTNTPDTSPEAVERLIAWLMDAHETGNTEKNPYVWRTLEALSAALEGERAENLILRQANEGLSSAAWTATTRAEAAEAERAALKSKLRNVISHATMGALTDPDASLNAIGVKTTEMRNKVFEDIYSERDALKAELAEAVEVLTLIKSIRPMWEGGVRGPSADNLSNTLEHMRAEARAFVARHQKEADT